MVWSSRCVLLIDEADGEEGPGRELLLEAWSSLYRCRDELVVSAGELVCEDEDCDSGRSRELSFSRSIVLPTSCTRRRCLTMSIASSSGHLECVRSGRGVAG